MACADPFHGDHTLLRSLATGLSALGFVIALSLRTYFTTENPSVNGKIGLFPSFSVCPRGERGQAVAFLEKYGIIRTALKRQRGRKG